MIKIGKYNELQVVKIVDFGLYLDGEDYGKILMPRKYVPEDARIGDVLQVFVYRDSKDRLISTTAQPALCVGEVAQLTVAQTGKVGAFLSWGLEKDLFLPFREKPRL